VTALPLPAAAALAAVLAVVALYCGTSAVVRLADAPGPGIRSAGGADGGGLRGAAADAVHAVMAVLMVAMVVPATASLVPPVAGAVLCGLAVGGWSLVLVRDGLRAVAGRRDRVPATRSDGMDRLAVAERRARGGDRAGDADGATWSAVVAPGLPVPRPEDEDEDRVPGTRSPEAIAADSGAAARRGSTCGTHPLHLVAVSAAMGVMYLAMLPAPAAAATRVAAAPGMPGMAMDGMHHGPHAVAASTPATSTLLLLAAVALGGYLLLHAAATATAPLRGVIGGSPLAAGPGAVGPGAVGPGAVGAAAGGTGAPPGLLHRLVDSPGAQHACQALMSGAMGLGLLLQLG
jgi:hypothetical protein